MTAASHRGILYPQQLPQFTRLPPPTELEELVQWFWIPEWDFPVNVTSRQHIIGFPSSNLVIEGGAVTLTGPTTARTFRDLQGKGWAVGALLRPAILPQFTNDPGSICDGEIMVVASDLCSSVTKIMDDHKSTTRHEQTIAVFSEWLLGHKVVVTKEARLANALFDATLSSPEIVRSADLATHLNVSQRQLQRLAKKYIGVTPLALIKRRQIQEATDLLRDNATTDISALAHDLGYADHAHFTNEFHRVIGLTPQQYRNQQMPSGPESTT